LGHRIVRFPPGAVLPSFQPGGGSGRAFLQPIGDDITDDRNVTGAVSESLCGRSSVSMKENLLRTDFHEIKWKFISTDIPNIDLFDFHRIFESSFTSAPKCSHQGDSGLISLPSDQNAPSTPLPPKHL
jgi:hypothetical protein